VLLPRLEDYYGARVVETRYDDFGEWVSNVLDGIAAKRFVVSSFDLGFLNSRREYHRVYSPHFVYFFGWEGRDTTFLACEQTTGISRIPLYDLRDFHDHRRRRGEAVLLLGLDPRSPLKERPVKESELREQLERSRDNLRSSQDHLGLRALRRFARDIASFAAETPRPFAVPGLWVFSHDLYLLERYLATAVPEVGGHVEPRLMALIARLHQLWLSVDMRLENGLYNGDVSQTRAAVANMENIVSGEEELALALEAFIFTLHGRDRPTYPTPEAVPGAIP